MSFKDWMDKVDETLTDICGMNSKDLPDCSYADWFADGFTPSRAVKLAIQNAKS